MHSCAAVRSVFSKNTKIISMQLRGSTGTCILYMQAVSSWPPRTCCDAATAQKAISPRPCGAHTTDTKSGEAELSAKTAGSTSQTQPCSYDIQLIHLHLINHISGGSMADCNNQLAKTAAYIQRLMKRPALPLAWLRLRPSLAAATQARRCCPVLHCLNAGMALTVALRKICYSASSPAAGTRGGFSHPASACCLLCCQKHKHDQLARTQQNMVTLL